MACMARASAASRRRATELLAEQRTGTALVECENQCKSKDQIQIHGLELEKGHPRCCCGRCAQDAHRSSDVRGII
eukprot:2413859-Rhodomonas_salina.2